MSNSLVSFKRYLELEKEAQHNTVDSYTRDVSTFLRAMCLKMKAEGDITGDDVQAYLDGMLDAGLSVSSVRRAKASIRCYFSFLKKGGAGNPTDKAKVGKSRKEIPEVLTKGEVKALLEATVTGNEKGVRDKCMIGLLYATGMKVSELISIKIDDVTTLEGYVRCIGAKGSRFVPINADASKSVANYLKLRGAQNPEDVLFLNNRGEGLTRQGFWKLLRVYAEKAGLKKKITPQVLRYTLALHLLENGANKQMVQEIMGYSDISSLYPCMRAYKGRIAKDYDRL